MEQKQKKPWGCLFLIATIIVFWVIYPMVLKCSNERDRRRAEKYQQELYEQKKAEEANAKSDTTTLKPTPPEPVDPKECKAKHCDYPAYYKRVYQQKCKLSSDGKVLSVYMDARGMGNCDRVASYILDEARVELHHKHIKKVLVYHIGTTTIVGSAAK